MFINTHTRLNFKAFKKDFDSVIKRAAKKGRVENKNSQKSLFQLHLEIAKKIDKPLILHCREAFDDLLEILTWKQSLPS